MRPAAGTAAWALAGECPRNLTAALQHSSMHCLEQAALALHAAVQGQHARCGQGHCAGCDERGAGCVTPDAPVMCLEVKPGPGQPDGACWSLLGARSNGTGSALPSVSRQTPQLLSGSPDDLPVNRMRRMDNVTVHQACPTCLCLLACLPITGCLPISMHLDISALPACTTWDASGSRLCRVTLTTLVVSILLCVKLLSLLFPICVLSRPQRGAIWPLTAAA